MTSSPPPDASGTARGLVNLVAQTFAGIKTFTNGLIASAAVTINSTLYVSGVTTANGGVETNSGSGYVASPVFQSFFGAGSVIKSASGTGASDVCWKIGASTADGSVNTAARLAQFTTGIGGTEVAQSWIRKAGSFVTKDAIGVGLSSDLDNVAAGLKYNAGANLGVFSLNGASGLYINLGTGISGCSGQFTSGQTITSGDGNFAAPTSIGAVVKSPLGAGATDVALKVGSSVADASVNVGAKLLSVRTGLGGTEVERAWFKKSGTDGFLLGASLGQLLIDSSTGTSLSWNGVSFATLDTNGVTLAATLVTNRSPATAAAAICVRSGPNATANADCISHAFGDGLLSAPNYTAYVRASGRFDQSGTDSSASPGAQTVAKPIGKNAIALGASSVVITNSLVTAASVVLITPHARDATCKELIAVPAAGSFTVSGSANATAALPFSWEIKTLL